ncbi:aldehyde dehydrogenase family protein [Rouxiella sp. Mn2063]|uniref:aldehyde dehydrogenase family protein n=1 Tax=Rouxiella sp. Mn2063 TaxID=3395262 RepID=UPI003BC7AC0D
MTVTHCDNMGNILQLQTTVVRNPWNNVVVAELAVDSPRQAQAKLAAAWAYHPNLSCEQRYHILSRARQLLQQNKPEIAVLISEESGLSLQDTYDEVEIACVVLHYAAEQALLMAAENCPSAGHSETNADIHFSRRSPLSGIIAAITSFNHPLAQVVCKVAPAIVTNNRIVLNPCEKTPSSALALHKILSEAGMPSKMFTLVNCSVAAFLNLVVAQRYIDLLSFTGCPAAGEEVARKVTGCKLTLEIDSNDTMIIAADADLKQAAALAARGAFSCSGQRSSAIRRVLVDRRCHAAFVRCLAEEAQSYRTGNPLDTDVKLGTLIDEISAAEIEQRIRISVNQGACCVTGNQRDGAMLTATVLTGVTADMPLMAKATFGPVALVTPYTSIESAIRKANDAGLAGNVSVITCDQQLISRFMKELQVAKVIINGIPGFYSEELSADGVSFSANKYQESMTECCLAYTCPQS